MAIFEKESSGLVPFLLGFSAGAVCATLLDPRRGAARRARLRDQALSLAREAGREAVRQGRDLRQRALGAVYEASTRAAGDLVPDEVLVERVRAQIGRPVSHPRAIEVKAENGEVTLSGRVLRSEVRDLLERVAGVRGVQGIRDELLVVGEEASGPRPPASGKSFDR